jgi:hypothetical protein
MNNFSPGSDITPGGTANPVRSTRKPERLGEPGVCPYTMNRCRCGAKPWLVERFRWQVHCEVCGAKSVRSDFPSVAVRNWNSARPKEDACLG